ncbi:ankyrin repeat-containing domain protein [Chytridium lagenaria]|nr:ankyrin repeat-containing domain protein [Chytridium lagenaria]
MRVCGESRHWRYQRFAKTLWTIQVCEEGECKKPKPGIFDFEGRAKWDSWKSCSALTTEDACSEYVACVKENTNWGQDTEADGKAKGKGSSTGVSVSVMEWEGPIVSDEDKTVFDWVAEGDVEKLKKLVTVNIIRELVDDNGLTLLHWASDRGNVDIAKYLLANNANVNGQDNDGMTPLHYAAINGHMELPKSCWMLERMRIFKTETGKHLQITVL